MADNKAASKKWRQKNPEKAKAACQRWYRANKEKVRLYPYKDVDLSSITERPTACQICGDGGKICLDHCHERMVFRGWLCDRCNKVLGLVRDNAALLGALADYVVSK